MERLPTNTIGRRWDQSEVATKKSAIHGLTRRELKAITPSPLICLEYGIHLILIQLMFDYHSMKT
jgi:hypothetical protein